MEMKNGKLDAEKIREEHLLRLQQRVTIFFLCGGVWILIYFQAVQPGSINRLCVHLHCIIFLTYSYITLRKNITIFTSWQLAASGSLNYYMYIYMYLLFKLGFFTSSNARRPLWKIRKELWGGTMREKQWQIFKHFSEYSVNPHYSCICNLNPFQRTALILNVHKLKVT